MTRSSRGGARRGNRSTRGTRPGSLPSMPGSRKVQSAARSRTSKCPRFEPSCNGLPEILEVEPARALIDARALHRTIEQVYALDAWFLKRGLTARALRSSLRGRQLTKARRRGKLILVDTDGGPVLGLHLGMSG